MAKFNVVQKKRRALKADRKRAVHGDPSTGKLKTKPQSLSVSGKRQRKLLKKWRRDQKEAVEKGLLTMQDVEMAAADEYDGGDQSKQDARNASTKFPIKKKPVKLKQLKRRQGKKAQTQSPKPSAAQASTDAMVE